MEILFKLLSVEPSFTTINSKFGKDWFKTELIVALISTSLLNSGIITEKKNCLFF